MGGLAVTAFHPLPIQKYQLIKCFLSLIYDTKSMLVDTSNNAFKLVNLKHVFQRGLWECIRGGFLTLSMMALMARAGAEDNARRLC